MISNRRMQRATRFGRLPLWGLRFRRPLLHDGAAANIEHAIERHKGEATGASERFTGLSAGDRHDVLTFLRSL